MLTSTGKFLRKLRIDRSEILKTMAGKLNVSSAFLSAVENGKKRFPDSWYEKLKTEYELSDEQVDDLKQAVMESSETVELNVSDAPDANRRLAVSFARKFASLDEETSKKILNLLNK